MMGRPETVDMMTCLKDACYIFMMSPEKVSKHVLEELRYLDSTIVLSLVRMRSDFPTQVELYSSIAVLSSLSPM